MRTIMILMILIGSMVHGYSQEVTSSSPEYHYLDSICRWAIGKFGEKGFIESCANVEPRITLKKYMGENENYGRNYYEIIYETKSIRLEYGYIAKITIWQDTREFHWLMFGTGWGFAGEHIKKKLEEEKAGKPFTKITFQVPNWDSLTRVWKKSLEEREAMERRLKAKAHEEYQQKMARIREERERQDSVRNSAARDSMESKE